MNRRFRILTVCLAMAGAGCATPLTPEQLADVRTIAIENAFPEQAKFTLIGTTIFNNKYNTVGDIDYKSFLTEQVQELVRARGYTLAATLEDADIVLQLQPNSIYGMVDSEAYGIYGRTFMGATTWVKSYVAINIVPYRDGKHLCIACYAKSLTNIDIDSMPEEWSQLTPDEQAAADASLRADIKKAVQKAFESTGL